MHHSMEIELKQPGAGGPVFTCHTRRIGARLWQRLFGTEKIVILVPGDSVDTVTIKEKEGGAGHEQDKAAAGRGGRVARARG